MKPIIALLCLLMTPALWAAEGNFPLDRAPIDLDNKASLQRGAQLFVNYCMGCHSLEYKRYGRLAQDLGLTDRQVLDNLAFNPDTKAGDTLQIGMDARDARGWFGAAPPDLSVISRARGVDYLYTYLRTFYLDESRPLGVNNAVYPAVGMPHVLWEMQGWQKPVFDAGHHLVGFEVVKPGSMAPAEFDRAMGDLVNFLAYVGEPIRRERERMGFWVLAFLALAFGVFTALKHEYWKDVH